jgi:NAD(P)H-dependent FMN reductase
MLNIKIIIGSTRDGRFGEKPAQWMLGELKKKENINSEIIDLRDYPLPFYNEKIVPIMNNGMYENEIASKLAKKISEADAIIIATPEYNHGYPAVLKNAMDYIYNEWNKKPVGFIGWGGIAGSHSIDQLREVCIGLQMAPIRDLVYIPNFSSLIDENDNLKTESLQKGADNFIAELIWWAKTLKAGRESQI